MLEFIVLGQVPGTNIQITFTWVILAGLTLGLTALVTVELPRLLRHARKQLPNSASSEVIA